MRIGTSRVIPILPRDVVRRRDGLWDKLAKGLGHRLIIVQAGPGCGKTTFLASFAQSQQRIHPPPVAWLTLDRVHQDRVQLLEDMVLAAQAARPEIGAMTLAAISMTRDVLRRWDYLLEVFCRETYGAELGPFLLVLDQYERIADSPGSAETLDYLLNAFPPTLTLLLVTRQPPNLTSIPRLRAQGEVWDISAEDLYFTVDEIRQVFVQRRGMVLVDEVLEPFMAKTGGWPAIVQMAGAMASSKGDHILLTFSGSLPQVYDYLEAEVFQKESPGARLFLMTSALAEEISHELGRALAAEAESLEALARFERGDYFVTASGSDAKRVYRYNPVFRDFLLKKLNDTVPVHQLRQLHLKLADFYYQSQQWDAAISHYLGAQEYQKASEVIASLAEAAIATNNLETLAMWIDAFPPEEKNRRPWLLLYRGVAHRVKQEWEPALNLYNRAISGFREQGERSGLARALSYASQILAYRRNQLLATVMASEALTLLEPSDFHSRAWILHSMGNSFFDLGKTAEALRCHQEARELFTAMGDTRGDMMECQALGLALHRLGHLKEAQQYYLRALGLQARSGDINMLCWVQAGLAHLRALRGDYSDSASGLQEAIEIARTHHLRPAEAFALSCLADVYLDLGENDKAEACCQQALAACEGFDDDTPVIDTRLKLLDLFLRTTGTSPGPETNLSIAALIAASNLELQKVAHAQLEASICLLERRFDEAEHKASEARSLASQLDAKYYEAMACYLSARIALQKGDLESSAKSVEELLALVASESYTSFLIREPVATGELLANALRYLPAQDGVAALLLKLTRLRKEVLTPLLRGGALPPLQRESVLRAEMLHHLSTVATENPFEASLPVEAKTRPPETAKSLGTAIKVFFLGPMVVQLGGQAITDRAWRTAKAKELFAFLLTEGNGSATRDELLELLWPDLGMDSAVSNFHFTLHSLRRALEPLLPAGSSSSYIVLSGRRYRLELPGETWVDVREFKSLLGEASKLLRSKQGERTLSLLARAVELYKGDYLADFYVEWVEQERRHLLRVYLDALRQLAWSAYARRDYDQVVRYANTMVGHDNCLEDAYRLLMRSACETGIPAQALRYYDELTKLLQSELNSQPEAATRRLYLRIREGTYQRPSSPPADSHSPLAEATRWDS